MKYITSRHSFAFLKGEIQGIEYKDLLSTRKEQGETNDRIFACESLGHSNVVPNHFRPAVPMASE
jgi:hypothetical protein